MSLTTSFPKIKYSAQHLTPRLGLHKILYRRVRFSSLHLNSSTSCKFKTSQIVCSATKYSKICSTICLDRMRKRGKSNESSFASSPILQFPTQKHESLRVESSSLTNVHLPIAVSLYPKSKRTCSLRVVYYVSIQFHHAILLLHRPFLKALYRGQGSGQYDPDGKDIHSRACKSSALKIAKILRIFRSAYSSVSVPTSTEIYHSLMWSF